MPKSHMEITVEWIDLKMSILEEQLTFFQRPSGRVSGARCVHEEAPQVAAPTGGSQQAGCRAGCGLASASGTQRRTFMEDHWDLNVGGRSRSAIRKEQTAVMFVCIPVWV